MASTVNPPAFVIGLLGAESTGKTTLAQALGEALRARGLQVAVVEEYLREFCLAEGRTPVHAEQNHIAHEQARRIDEAARQGHAVVVADTTALTIAVYSEVVFADRALYPWALAAHRRCGLTLLTALDLPWQADGMMRDGPHARAPVDALFRARLQQAGLAYGVVAGLGEARLAHALRGVEHALGLPPPRAPDAARREEDGDGGWVRWRMACDRCSDPDCERRCLLPPRA
jgi:nicotinamide riboside kinase